jgi:RNA polymerase sigma-70 factor (ECF subfamily)
MKFLKLFSAQNETKSDLELVELYKQTSDNRHVGELFNRYTHLVFGVCMKYLKDEEESRDAVMLIFEKLLTDLKRFEIQNFAPWLHRLTQNFCLMYLRQKERDFKRTENLKNNVYADMESQPNWHLSDEADSDALPTQIRNIEEALKHLKENQRLCLVLFYLEEKSYQEVAAQTGFSLGEVKSYIQNGRRNIKKLLGILCIAGSAVCLCLFF